jgi:hypothetical protein
MERSLQHLLLSSHFPSGRMAFVVGPRQVGKTTLARRLLAARGSEDLYRNWDDLAWRRAFARDPYGFLDAFRPRGRSKPLVALDEIHKHPQWKRYLKGLWDLRHERLDVIVTGSGRLDVYQRGGDSLLGRYHQYRLHPLSVREVIEPGSPGRAYSVDDTLRALRQVSGKPRPQLRKVFESLLTWGGFPEPFLAQDEKQLRLWHAERRTLLVREDLRDLSRIQLLSHVEELVELLGERSGTVLSLQALHRDLQASVDSVRLWVQYLQRLFYLFLLRPYAGRLARALRREPKLYLWDWSEVRDPGRRLENLVASHLLKWCDYTGDFGHPALRLHFLRDKEQREVDFLVTREKKPWLLIEVKRSREEPPAALHYFAAKLGVPNKFLVVADLEQPGLAGDVQVIDAATFLGCLPV